MAVSSSLITNGVTTAFNAIGDLAISITIRKSVQGTYDPNTDSYSSTISDSTALAVLDDIDIKDLSGDLAQLTDLFVYVKPFGSDIDVGDELIISNTTYTVISSMPIKSSSTVFLWKLLVRK